MFCVPVKIQNDIYAKTIDDIITSEDLKEAIKYNNKYGIVKCNYGNIQNFIAHILHGNNELYKEYFEIDDVIYLNAYDMSAYNSLGYLFAANEYKPIQVDSWQRVKEKSEDFSSYKFDISKWDTSNVKSLCGTFAGNKNQFDISEWDVSNVENIDETFMFSEFKGDLSSWNFTKLNSTTKTFKGSVFNGDISKWNISRVVNMEEMFYESQFDGDLSSWNTIRVRNMKNMFSHAFLFQGSGIENWNVSHVEDMEGMFEYN